MGPCAVDDENQVGSTGDIEDCPWKLVDAPASVVVAKMMLFGWQVLSGTEFGTHKRCSEVRICGSRRVACRASSAYDRWTGERAMTRLLALALVGGPPLPAPLKLANAALALQSVFMGTMRTQNLEWLECFSLAQIHVGSLWHRCFVSEEF